jgi:hypothetical protein
MHRVLEVNNAASLGHFDPTFLFIFLHFHHTFLAPATLSLISLPTCFIRTLVFLSFEEWRVMGFLYVWGG